MKEDEIGNAGISLGLLLRAIVFSVLLLLPAIIRYWQNGEGDIDFVHIDESVYLRLPYDAYEQRAPESIYFEHIKKEESISFLFRYPNAVIDYGVGQLAGIFGWGPVALGLFLDFSLAAISYVLVSRFFLTIFGLKLLAESAALVFLAFPSSLILSQYVELPLPFLPQLVPALYRDYSLAVHRGIYTQVSYVPYLLSLGLLASAVLANKKRNRSWFLLGCCTALLLYCYVFAWASALAIVLQIIVLEGLFHKQRVIPLLASRFAAFFSGHLLIGALGFSILRRQDMMDLVASPLFAEYWFFSPTLALSGIFFAGSGFLSKGNPKICLGFLFLLSCSIAEIVLMNLQPLLRQSLTPYQMPTKYLHPLMSSMSLALFLQILAEKKLFRFLYPVYGALVFAIYLAVVQRTVRATLVSPDSPSDSRELIETAPRILPENSVIAVMPVLQPFANEISREFSVSTLPTLVTSMLNRPVLYQDWISLKRINDSENVKRELALGWLFSGETKLVWPCPKEKPELPGDIYTLTWTDRLIKRAQYCESQKTLIESYTACDALKDFRVDYLLWQTSFDFPKPAWHESLTESIWKTRSGNWELKRFRQEDALRTFCE